MNRVLMLLISGGLAGSSVASPMFFNSTTFAGNAAVRDAWLGAIGITSGQFLVDFESISVGTNVNGLDLGGGLTIVHPSGSALVQSNASFFGSSNPIGTRAVALQEVAGTITLNFTSPVDYVGGFDIDMPGATLRATFADNSTAQISLDTTGSSGDTAEFWGVWRNDAATITKLEFIGTSGGDGEWGLDNLEYGAVPEPGTLVAIGAGLTLARLRRR